jgi:XTP/dITP diphosphohydrolase
VKRLRVGTTNAGKLREFREMLAPLGFEVLGLEGVPGFHVDEDAPTFEGNAEKKARALSERTGEPALADDSGLMVDALAGAPGVHSARYAGVSGPDQDAKNRHKLLAALRHVTARERTARFVCALAYVEPKAPTRLFHGTLEGRIGFDERGSGGFGYDPLFELADSGRTLAELSSAEKHAISHRGRALRAFLAALEADAG